MTTKKEQKVNRKILADALRSGKYKQGKGCLHSGRSFCCLGVAMDIFSEEPWKLSNYVYVKEGVTHWLSPSVTDKLGFPNDVGYFTSEPTMKYLNTDVMLEANVDSLANLNDSGHSFEQIADVIENTDWEFAKKELNKKMARLEEN